MSFLFQNLAGFQKYKRQFWLIVGSGHALGSGRASVAQQAQPSLAAGMHAQRQDARSR
jgi:hypothetical protein